jgi:hypothetical protein
MSCLASSIPADHQTVFSLLSPHGGAAREWSNFISIEDPHIRSAMGVGQADGGINSVISFPVFFAVLFSLGAIFKLITVFHPMRQAQDYLRWYLFEPLD